MPAEHDDPEAIPGAKIVRKAIVRAYTAGTHKADIHLVGSHPTLVLAVRVATNIPAADVVAGRECSVLFLDPSNQDDAVVIAIQGAAPSGGGGGTKIEDADADTSVDTEASADEDKVRIITATVLRALFQTAAP